VSADTTIRICVPDPDSRNQKPIGATDIGSCNVYGTELAFPIFADASRDHHSFGVSYCSNPLGAVVDSPRQEHHHVYHIEGIYDWEEGVNQELRIPLLPKFIDEFQFGAAGIRPNTIHLPRLGSITIVVVDVGLRRGSPPEPGEISSWDQELQIIDIPPIRPVYR